MTFVPVNEFLHPFMGPSLFQTKGYGLTERLPFNDVAVASRSTPFKTKSFVPLTKLTLEQFHTTKERVDIAKTIYLGEFVKLVGYCYDFFCPWLYSRTYSMKVKVLWKIFSQVRAGGSATIFERFKDGNA